MLFPGDKVIAKNINSELIGLGVVEGSTYSVSYSRDSDLSIVIQVPRKSRHGVYIRPREIEIEFKSLPNDLTQYFHKVPLPVRNLP